MVKNLPANTGDPGATGSIPGLARLPRGGHGNPLQNSCLENPMDRGAWQGYSPWGHKESDRTEHALTMTVILLNRILAIVLLRKFRYPSASMMNGNSM